MENFKPSVITNTSYFVKIEPFTDYVNGEKINIDYGVVADSFEEELHFIKDNIRYIYEVDGDDVLFYKTTNMVNFLVVDKTKENKHLFDELFEIYLKQNKKYGNWISSYVNNLIKK